MTATTTRTATPAFVLALTLAASAATTTPGLGAPIAPGFSLSAAEAARPILLDADGNQLRVLKGLRGPTTVQPRGATPEYVAFRLDRSTELPAGYPTIQAGGRTPHQGPARGPLRLDTLAKSALDAELARTGAAAVQLPRQTYVVESLAGLSGNSGQVWLAPTAGGHVARPAVSGGTSVGDTLKGWLSDGADAIEHLNTSITDALKKQLHLAPPKPAIYPPLNRPRTAAQELAPPQPAPVPEPASLLVFAAAALAASLRMRKRAR